MFATAVCAAASISRRKGADRVCGTIQIYRGLSPHVNVHLLSAPSRNTGCYHVGRTACLEVASRCPQSAAACQHTPCYENLIVSSGACILSSKLKSTKETKRCQVPSPPCQLTHTKCRERRAVLDRPETPKPSTALQACFVQQQARGRRYERRR